MSALTLLLLAVSMLLIAVPPAHNSVPWQLLVVATARAFSFCALLFFVGCLLHVAATAPVLEPTDQPVDAPMMLALH